MILDVHAVCLQNTFAQHKMAKMKLGVILKGKAPPLHSEKMWIIITSFYSVLFGLIIELNCCAIIFVVVFSVNNDTLLVLDLSWNHIRANGAIGLCKGIAVSICIYFGECMFKCKQRKATVTNRNQFLTVNVLKK